ncbi:MAG: GNAT family N-acetyltransferase [Solirubrobacterales bacterium]
MMLRRAVSLWKMHGFGLWMFHSRETGLFIGRGGLIRYESLFVGGQEEIGLAYAVLSSYWSRGYATEMGNASLCVGFEHLGLDSIGAWTLPDNLASQRVMAKLGFRYERDIVFCSLPHRFFRLDRRDYHPSHACVESVTGSAPR